MASKRPLRTTAYRAGKVVNHGRASSLHGAILSASRRLMMKRIAIVEIMDNNEKLLATVRHHLVGHNVLLHRGAARLLERERRRNGK